MIHIFTYGTKTLFWDTRYVVVVEKEEGKGQSIKGDEKLKKR